MYPKTFTHRHDQHATVVVMNAEQESELPEEFRPVQAVGSVGQVSPAITTMTPAEALLLSPEYADFIADRDQLAVDRANLTAGYKADKALLDADRELLDAQRVQLDEERAQFEQEKASAVANLATIDKTSAAKTTKGASAAKD